MGRPIKKKWFTAKDGATGDLTLTTTSGDEPIIKQTGSRKYDVASGRVTLTDGVPATATEGQLTHNGKNVSKITQYRMYYFDGTESGVWRDGAGNVVGTLVPALTVEGFGPATASASITASYTVDAITVTDGGGGYAGAPVVTLSAPDATDATVSGFVAQTAADPDADQSALISNGGSGYASAPTVTQSGGTGTGATFTAVLTNGVVTSITASGGNTDYVGDETVTISAVTKTQATATSALIGDVVDTISVGNAGAGYVANPTVTVAAP